MLISYVIPVYNAGKYLRECIDSILKCNKDDFEIVLVDDGSKDDSYSIMKDYTNEHDNIKIFSKENGGAASARNNGLKNAIGKYICFVDSDDYLKSEDLTEITKILKDGKYDCVMLSTQKENQKQKKLLDKEYSKEDLIRLVTITDKLCGPCSKFYKKEIIDKNKLTFPEDMRIGEDTIFNIHFFGYANLALEKDIVFYFYRRNLDSLTSKFNYDVFYLNERIYNERKSLLKKNDLLYKYGNKLKMVHINVIFFKFIKMYKQGKEDKSFMKEYLINNYCKELFEGVTLKDINYKYKILYLLIKYKMINTIKLLSKVV